MGFLLGDVATAHPRVPMWVAVALGIAAAALFASLWWRARGDRRTDAALFAALADGQQRACGASVDVSVQAVVTAARRELRASEVEMVLLGAEGPVHYLDDGAAVSRRRVDCNAFDQPWVLNAMGAGGVRVSRDDDRPQCSAVIGSLDELRDPLAVLLVRRSSGAPRFGRADLHRVRLLVAQAERWFAAGAPESLAGAFGPRGAVEAAGAADPNPRPSPDLTLLRDSARRLSSLSVGPVSSDAVGQIVEELHSAERAVASLLGSMAMSKARSLADRAEELHVDPVARRAAEEWTTTGVLGSRQVA